MHFEKHVFICANDKDAPKKCCGSGHSMELIDKFKSTWAAQGLDTYPKGRMFRFLRKRAHLGCIPRRRILWKCSAFGCRRDY
jgi:hypothetical protein